MSRHRLRRLGCRRTAFVAGLGALVALVVVPLVGSTPAQASPATPLRSSALVPGTPCHIDMVACVALGDRGFNGKAWLIEDGRVARGPVDASTGGPGEDTPTGTFHVLSKDLSHRSSETTDSAGQPSAMPYSVFFTKSGVAFHGGGDVGNRTAGCIRLANADARYFFNNLNVGDTVEVVDGSSADYQPEPDQAPSRRRGGGLLGL